MLTPLCNTVTVPDFSEIFQPSGEAAEAALAINSPIAASVRFALNIAIAPLVFKPHVTANLNEGYGYIITAISRQVVNKSEIDPL